MPRRDTARADGGFLSNAKVFSLQPGPRVEPGSVRGYYIDLRVKADEPRWPPSWVARGNGNVGVGQWGLAAYERYLAGEGDAWLDAARQTGEYLVEGQVGVGAQAGGWPYTVPFPHTFRLKPPWLSAMAQGQGASLLVRLYLETGDKRFAEAGLRALVPLTIESSRGGVAAQLDGRTFPEEYPTSPPSFVLNGGIFALWGLYDAAIGLGDSAAEKAFDEGVEVLAENIHRWDTGYWSRYDLYPHTVVNVASSVYHLLHTNQLRVLHRLRPTAALSEAADRFEAYASSRVNRWHAFAAKAMFRVLVPRNPTLARRLPWSSLRR